tara:strand:- start:86 stop:430 length:345 start_codon:yes stop_codon:yes gene_type:complete
MAHYARITNGIVTAVIVAEDEFFDGFVDDVYGEWIQTSYNTQGGVHSEGGTPLRKNFASVGFIYNSEADAFYSPQPYPSWTLNTTTYLWEAPISHPDGDGFYVWDEENSRWNEE